MVKLRLFIHSQALNHTFPFECHYMSSLLEEHLGYVADERRLRLFEAAARQLVSPGDRVVDAGCGTGILGLICLKEGAGHVSAIESSDMIEVARETFERAGWAEKTSLHKGMSFEMDLPRDADLVVCDHVGYFGFDYGLIDILADSRRRFLRPGGKLMPSRLKLKLAAVGSARLHEAALAWERPAIPIEFHWVGRLGANEKRALFTKPEEFLSPCTVLASIDLHEDQAPFMSWPYELKIDQDGEIHGLLGSFECELAPGVWMSNDPLTEGAIDRPQAFLPFPAPIKVEAGDFVTGTVSARPKDHLIAWVARHAPSKQERRGSTWEGEILPRDALKARQPGHAPRLTTETKRREIVLGYCDGQRTVQTIKDLVMLEHPTLMSNSDALLDFVVQVLANDTE